MKQIIASTASTLITLSISPRTHRKHDRRISQHAVDLYPRNPLDLEVGVGRSCILQPDEIADMGRPR
jgi:hypothetical protein